MTKSTLPSLPVTQSKPATDAPTNCAESTGSAFFQAKIAFKIPGHYMRDGVYGRRYDDKLIDKLMDLFADTEFETENLCSPALLIVNVSEVPTPDWFAQSVERINSALQNNKACNGGTTAL